MFRIGDTVIFDPSTFNPDYWHGLSEQDRRKYYGDLYNFDNPGRPFLFTFICQHMPQTGHCVLINMQNQKIETMRYIGNFRQATDEEC